MIIQTETKEITSKMDSKLKELEPFLKVLDFKNTDKIPTFSELKKAYRDKMHLHPDKAGADSTEAFQEITEAVNAIFYFLVDNVDL